MMHTKGPWMVEPHSDRDELVNVVSEYVVLPDGSRYAHWIAELDAHIDMDSDVEACLEQVNANAHLIAAAPDLLAALKEALNFIEGDRDFTLGNAYPEDYAMRERIKAAIARAEGRAELHKGQQ
jgi:hypothetical protein